MFGCHFEKGRHDGKIFVNTQKLKYSPVFLSCSKQSLHSNVWNTIGYFCHPKWRTQCQHCRFDFQGMHELMKCCLNLNKSAYQIHKYKREQSSFTHLLVTSNLSDFGLPVKQKRRYFEECLKPHSFDEHWLQLWDIFFKCYVPHKKLSHRGELMTKVLFWVNYLCLIGQ